VRRASAARWVPWLLLGVPVAAFAIWALSDNARLFLTTLLNSLTLASLYFLVASGFTLVFGLMRNVNLAHGSLYLFGAYVGWMVGDKTGSWLLAVAAGFLAAALVGLLLQLLVFRHMQGQDLRQTLVTIGISIVLADLMLWTWGAEIYTFDPPSLIYGSTSLPVVEKFPTYRLAVLVGAIAIGVGLWWFLARTKVGMMIRAGVDDRGMLAASGVNV
jgi:branched-chain amino acid transport system permease protein